MAYFDIAISGCRTFDDFWDFAYALDDIILPNHLRKTIRLFEGGARGADKLAAKYCIARKLEHKRFDADWDNLGRKAGILRNIEMIDAADMLIAFWDGESAGTGHAIEHAVKKGKRTIIVRVDLDMKVIEISPNGGYTCQKLESSLQKLPFTTLRRSILSQEIENYSKAA